MKWGRAVYKIAEVEWGFGEFVNRVKDFLSSEKGGFDSENRMWYNLRKIPQNTEIAENH